LLLDVLNRLIEVERLSVRPDKFALLGIELHVLHQITEASASAQLLDLGRMPPLEEIIEEGIVGENIVFQVFQRFHSLRHLPAT
jgi:hypothetical protein